MLLEKYYLSATMWGETGLAVALTRQRGMFHVNIARDKWQTATTQAGAVINDRVPQARVRAKPLIGLCSVYWDKTGRKQQGIRNQTGLSWYLRARNGASQFASILWQERVTACLWTQDVNNTRVVVQEPIKFKWIPLNVCPIFHLIFKWKKNRQLLQLCLCFWDYLNYVTNPCPTED